jgi:riboflavin kinase/FMN adenylyltransferase
VGERPAVANWGLRPTFGEGEVVFEVHLLDGPVRLAAETVEVEIVGRLREERKFSDANALTQQIARDVVRARDLLAGNPAPY